MDPQTPPQTAPPVRVQIQGMGVVEFPAGTSQAEMQAAIEKHIGSQNQQPRELTLQERKVYAEQGTLPPGVPPPQQSQSEDLFPMIGGAIGGFVGGIPGAAIGGGAGEAVRQTVSQLRGREPVRTPMQTAKGIVGEGIVQGATEGVGQGLAAFGRWAAPRVMQSAIKPSVEAAMDTTKAGVPKVVQTMLDEHVAVTPNGVKKLYDILDTTGKQVNTTVQLADKYLPKTIHPQQTVDRALELTKGFVDQVNASQDLKAIADSANQFLDEQVAKQTGRTGALGPAKPIGVADAQSMKTGTYRALGNKAFGELKGASVEAQKAQAVALKEQIEALVPSVQGQNARYGAVSDALDATARRVGVTGNRDLGGIFWVAHNPEAFLAAQFDRSPAVKSLLALGLYDQAGKVAKVAPSLLRLAMAAIATAPEPDMSVNGPLAQGFGVKR